MVRSWARRSPTPVAPPSITTTRSPTSAAADLVAVDQSRSRVLRRWSRSATRCTASPTRRAPMPTSCKARSNRRVGPRTTISSIAAIATFTFPYEKGHMRARLASSITTTGSTFSSGTVLFDAGASTSLPTVTAGGCATFAGTCRNVFTITSSPPRTERRSIPRSRRSATPPPRPRSARLIVPANGAGDHDGELPDDHHDDPQRQARRRRSVDGRGDPVPAARSPASARARDDRLLRRHRRHVACGLREHGRRHCIDQQHLPEPRHRAVGVPPAGRAAG